MKWIKRLLKGRLAEVQENLPRGEVIDDTASPLLRRSVRVFAAAEGGSDIVIEILEEGKPPGTMLMQNLRYSGLSFEQFTDAMFTAMGLRPNPRLDAEVRTALNSECQAILKSHPKWAILRDLMNEDLQSMSVTERFS